MRDSFAPCQLRLRLADISDDLELVDEGFILIHIENDRGTPAMLSDDERTLGRPDLVKQACCVCPKRGKGLNILARLQGRHTVPSMIRVTVPPIVLQTAGPGKSSALPNDFAFLLRVHDANPRAASCKASGPGLLSLPCSSRLWLGGRRRLSRLRGDCHRSVEIGTRAEAVNLTANHSRRILG